jgi:hypothetical protein
VPFKVTSIAVDVVHERVLDWPDSMDIGDAEILAVGAPVELVDVEGVDGVEGVEGVGVGVVDAET